MTVFMSRKVFVLAYCTAGKSGPTQNNTPGYDAFPFYVACATQDVENGVHKAAAIRYMSQAVGISLAHPLLALDEYDPLGKVLMTSVYDWDTVSLLNRDGQLIGGQNLELVEHSSTHGAPIDGQLAVAVVNSNPVEPKYADSIRGIRVSPELKQLTQALDAMAAPPPGVIEKLKQDTKNMLYTFHKLIIITTNKQNAGISIHMGVRCTQQQFEKGEHKDVAIKWLQSQDTAPIGAPLIIADSRDPIWADFDDDDCHWAAGPEIDLEPTPAPKPVEKILVLPTKHYRSLFLHTPGGLRMPLVPLDAPSLVRALAEDLVKDAHLPSEFEFSFTERNDAIESNTDFLQPIPYIVFTHGRSDIREIFVYQRSKGQGEKRLLKMWSVGIGGHCNPSGGKNPYREAVLREIQEELGAPGYDTFTDVNEDMVPRPDAFIYDTSVPVNAVHLGGVHLTSLPGRVDFDCEESMANPGWEPLLKAYNRLSEFEPWSQLVLRWLVEGKAPVLPSNPG